MQHSIHVMFGKASSEVLLELRRYIALYSDEETASYFTALHYISDKEGVLVEKVVQKAEEKVTFTTNLHDQWIPVYAEEFKIGKQHLESELQAQLVKFRNQRISQNTEGEDTLLYCLYVPLYDTETWKQVLFLVKQIQKAMEGKRVLIDIIGLSYDLAEVLEPDKATEYARRMDVLKQNTREVIDEIVALRHKKASSAYINNFVVLQNQTNARALELTAESLVSIMGEYALLCIESYTDAFGRSIEKGDVQGLGISMLSFDTYYFQEYLLQDSFIKILEKERIDESEVDISWAALEIEKMLQSWLSIYKDFYTAEILTRSESEQQLKEILPQIHPRLEAEFNHIKQSIVNHVLRNEELSLPRKKALLSVLLGQDDPLFGHSTLINSKQTILIDLERQCVNFFIDENNALLDRKETENDTILPPFSDESKQAKLPIDELKELRFRERNYIANIREMEDEIADIKQNLTQLDESKKCLIEGGKIIYDKEEFILIHHDDDIEPLEEKYEPHPVTIKNIDISGGFTEIKSQGQQGACMSFSMVSVFEYFMKKNHIETPDLSEQFLYYNARKRRGREQYDEGSCSVASIQTLFEDGICTEEAWPYNEQGYSEQPSEAAYDEAKRRRVKRAVMVEKKIEALKSALDDGLPIVFAVDVFPSFVQGINGFVSMPSDEEVQHLKESGENHSHAMVLCGFNDEQQVFKVRNSWGESFGDRGYCYLPYDYVMQYGYWDCVAIQEIELAQEIKGDGGEIEKIEGSVFTIKQTDRPQLYFSETDLRIRYALRVNHLERLKRELKALQKSDMALQEYYESVKLPLRDRNKRDQFYRDAMRHKALQVEELEQEKISTETQHKEIMRSYDMDTVRGVLRGLSYFISLSAVLGTFDYLLAKGKDIAWMFNWIPMDFLRMFINDGTWKGRFFSWLLGRDVISTVDSLQVLMRFLWVLLVIGAILFVGIYIWYRIDKRKEMIRRLAAMIKEIQLQIEEIKDNMSMLEAKFHLAGDMISGLYRLVSDVQKYHMAISHYILNLKQWLSDTRNAHKAMRAEARAPFVSLIQNGILESYFNDQQEAIIDTSNLWEFIENYTPSEEGIVRVQQDIKKKLLEKISEKFASLSIADYLICLKDKEAYPYLVHDFDDICELFKDLSRKSDLFLQYKQPKEGTNARQVMLIRTSDEDERMQLLGKLKHVMPAQMSVVETKSPYKIIFFTKRELEKEQVII